MVRCRCQAATTYRLAIRLIAIGLLSSLLGVYYFFGIQWMFVGVTPTSLKPSCYEQYVSDIKLQLHFHRERLDEQFQIVGEYGSHSYVYSAYIDDRINAQDISPADAPVVRIMAWLRRRQPVVSTWRCLFWFQDVDIPLEVNFVSKIDIDVFTLNRYARLMPVMLTCPYQTHTNTSSTELKPLAVSVVPSSCHRPQNVIPLTDLRLRPGHYRSDKYELTASDPVPLPAAPGRVDSFPLNFTMCVSTLYNKTAYQLVEFIEVNRVLGAQRFVFYVDPSRNDTERLMPILRHYERTGLVELHRWTLPADTKPIVHYHGQILQVNDCLYRVMYVSKYSLFHDMDELVVPATADDWMSMLEQMLEQISRSVPHPETIAAYSFSQRMIPAQLPDDVEYWNTSHPLVRKFSIKALLKTTADAVLYEPTYRPKPMYRPDRMLTVHVHSVFDSSFVRRRSSLFGLLSVGDRTLFVDSKFAELHHYRKPGKIMSRRTTRLTRMHRFESRIVERLEELMKQGVGPMLS